MMVCNWKIWLSELLFEFLMYIATGKSMKMGTKTIENAYVLRTWISVRFVMSCLPQPCTCAGMFNCFMFAGIYVTSSFILKKLDSSAALMNAVVGTSIATLVVGELRHIKEIRRSAIDTK